MSGVPANFLLALIFLLLMSFMVWRICVMVTEHVLYFDLKGHFWVMRSVY